MDYLRLVFVGLLLRFVDSKGLQKLNTCSTKNFAFSCRCSKGHLADASGFTWETEGGLDSYVERGWRLNGNVTNSNTLLGVVPASAANAVVLLRCGFGSPMQIMNIIKIVVFDPKDSATKTDLEENIYVTKKVIEARCDSTASASDIGYKWMAQNNIPIDGSWEKKYQVSFNTKTHVFNELKMNVNLTNRNRLVTIYCQKDEPRSKVKVIRMFIMNNVIGKGFLEQTCPLTVSEKTLSCQGLVWTGVGQFQWLKQEGDGWNPIPDEKGPELHLNSIDLLDKYLCKGRVSERKWKRLVEFHFGDDKHLSNKSYVCGSQRVEDANKAGYTEQKKHGTTLISGVVVGVGGVVLVAVILFFLHRRRRRRDSGGTGAGDTILTQNNISADGVENG